MIILGCFSFIDQFKSEAILSFSFGADYYISKKRQWQVPETSVSISTQTPESSSLSDIKDKRLFSIEGTNKNRAN